MICSLRKAMQNIMGESKSYLHYYRRIINDYEKGCWCFDIRTLVKKMYIDLPCSSNLKVWKDLNQNGVSDAGELQTLTEAGITSISLTHTNTSVTDANGNIQSQIGSFTKSNGSTATIADYNSILNFINSSKRCA